jgi:hypothetical protein
VSEKPKLALELATVALLAGPLVIVGFGGGVRSNVYTDAVPEKPAASEFPARSLIWDTLLDRLSCNVPLPLPVDAVTV